MAAYSAQHLAAFAAATQALNSRTSRPTQQVGLNPKGKSKGCLGRNPHPNHPGKIFVGNLPNDITKEVLYQVFSTYGLVSDVHVMVGKSDSGQACAFIE